MDKEPGLRDVVAELYANGANNQEIANAINSIFPELNVHKDTIIEYRRHPSVLAKIRRLIEERTTRITRKVDSKIEERLKAADKMDVKTLLEIRKTIAGDKHVIDDKRPEDGQRSAVEELFDAAQEDPEMAERIMAAQAAAAKKD